MNVNILKNNIDLLNKINVFPVADGDTGNNLNDTLKSIEHLKLDFTKEFFSDLSSSLLKNARGSSGNILTLYSIGLCNNYSNDLTSMFTSASQFVWNTLYNPVEGTILTAMKDVPQEYIDIKDFIYKFIQNTINNLLSGPDILSILKGNSTIDSGTLGFLYILCDIYEELTGINLTPQFKLTNVERKIKEEDPTYCVEVIFSNGNFNGLQEELSTIGEEIIVVSTSMFTKVHVHTDDFKKAIEICKKYGEIFKSKVENMKENNKEIFL